MYDEISGSYDELHSVEQKRKLMVVKSLLDIPEDTTVLDVGCGTGLSYLLGHKIIGIDLSAGMVKIAKSRMTASVADAHCLPFKDKSFGAVICISAVHNFVNPKKALGEIARVSTGLVIVSVLKRSLHFENIKVILYDLFKVEKQVEDLKDIIFCCRVK